MCSNISIDMMCVKLERQQESMFLMRDVGNRAGRARLYVFLTRAKRRTGRNRNVPVVLYGPELAEDSPTLLLKVIDVDVPGDNGDILEPLGSGRSVNMKLLRSRV